MKNETAFSMAGIYDIGVDKESGKQHATFSIITIVTDPLTDYIPVSYTHLTLPTT